jgi:hypothetical protein
MKMHLLLIPMLLLCACRTTAGTKEKKSVAKPYAAQSEMLLQKIIGGSKDEKVEEGQYFECKVMSDIAEAAEVKRWIAALPRETIQGFHIRATSPSRQLFAFDGGKPIVILKDWSDIVQAKVTTDAEKDAVDKLNKIVEKYCPTPIHKEK